MAIGMKHIQREYSLSLLSLCDETNSNLFSFSTRLWSQKIKSFFGFESQLLEDSNKESEIWHYLTMTLKRQGTRQI